MFLLDDVIRLLSTGATLPEQYRDHTLIGNYSDFRECHIKPDWLLIYSLSSDTLILTLSRTGSHSNLFSWQFEQEKRHTGIFLMCLFLFSSVLNID